jgi:hypothetical protein
MRAISSLYSLNFISSTALPPNTRDIDMDILSNVFVYKGMGIWSVVFVGTCISQILSQSSNIYRVISSCKCTMSLVEYHFIKTVVATPAAFTTDLNAS